MGGPDSDAGTGLRLDGTVLDVAYRGVDLLVTTEVTDPGGARIRLLSDVRGAGPGTFAAGQQVRLSIAPEHLTVLAG